MKMTRSQAYLLVLFAWTVFIVVAGSISAKFGGDIKAQSLPLFALFFCVYAIGVGVMLFFTRRILLQPMTVKIDKRHN